MEKMKGFIKNGSPAMQDFHFGKYVNDGNEPPQIWDIEKCGDRWKCTCFGYGEMGNGGYGNGAVYADDVIIINS